MAPNDEVTNTSDQATEPAVENPDHLTEDEALAQAKENGIEFEDRFTVTHNMPKVYDSQKEAEAFISKQKNPNEYFVVQERRRKT